MTLSDTAIANPIADTSQSIKLILVSAESDHGCTATDSVKVIIGRIDSVFITASDSALCAGDSNMLNANVVGNPTGVSYSWAPAGIMNDTVIQAPTASPTNDTIIGLTVTDTTTKCVYTDSLRIAVVNLNLDLGPADTVVCNSVGLVLNASHSAPDPTYSWDGGADLNDNSIQSPMVLLDSSKTYSVTLNDAAGCSATDSIRVIIPFENLISLPDTSFCEGDSLLLDATHPGSTYLWNGTDPSDSIFVHSDGIQTVQLTDTASGCQTSYSVIVTEHVSPVVDLGNDTTICAGQTLPLDAENTGSTFLWNTNLQTQTITVRTAGSYKVTVTNANNCPTTDSIRVSINQLPVIEPQGSTLCLGDSLVLDATWPDASYSWNNSETTPTITVRSSGKYIVTVTDTIGVCSTTDSMEVNFVPFPVVFLGENIELCEGQSLTLIGGDPLLPHTWGRNSTSGTISTSLSINPTETDIYWVDVANGSCVTRDSIGVVFNPLPTDNLINLTGCEGDNITLSAGNSGSDYLWNTNETTESINVSTPNTYTVSVTTPLNCSDTFDAVVSFETPPNVQLGDEIILCDGETLSLSTGYPEANNDWSTGEITESIVVAHTGTYDVIVNTTHCEARDTIEVTFNPSPIPSLPSELATCLDESPGYIAIDAGNPGSIFDWSTGEQTQEVIANAYGWYYVDITNSFDCTISDAVEVIEFCPSSMFVPNGFTPNGDGLNDVFMPVGNNIEELELFIFDRWGTMLFHTDDPTQGWDGTYQGKTVKAGVYSWRIVYALLDDFDRSIVGAKQESVGHVTVIR